jgi:hypothetical protein
MRFETWALAICYFHAFDDRDPTLAEIGSFGDRLYQQLDSTFAQAMARYGVPDTRRNRSAILVLAYSSRSAPTLIQRVLVACWYFRQTQLDQYIPG